MSVPYVLSVTLVYCGQTVGWIKMKLDTQVGHGIPNRGIVHPNFRPTFVVAKWMDGLRGLDQGDIVLDVAQSTDVVMARASDIDDMLQPPIFGPCLLWPNGWMH